MARLKFKKDVYNSSLRLSKGHVVLLNDYLTDDEYNFIVDKFPGYLEKPKKKKKKFATDKK